METFFMEISVVTMKTAMIISSYSTVTETYSKDDRIVDDKQSKLHNHTFWKLKVPLNSNPITINNWFILIFLFQMTNSTLSFELHLEVEKLFSLVPGSYEILLL